MLSNSEAETNSVRLLVWIEHANSSVSSRLLNCNTDVEERTERGRAFHVDGMQLLTGKTVHQHMSHGLKNTFSASVVINFDVGDVDGLG